MTPRRRRGRDIHGVVLLDKPAGVTSNHALQQVRRLFEARKAGHTGSLDPFATGLLPVCLGEATKTAAFLLDADKAYRASARLGERTDTADRDGEVVETAPVPDFDAGTVRAVLAGFVGPIEQVPPMYSALKHQGRRLHELARAGETVERAPRPVTIHALELVDWSPPDLVFDVRCSKGTYVRVLAEDIARELGTLAHLQALRRTAVGDFADDAHTLAELEALAGEGRLDEVLLPVDAALSAWPVVRLEDAAVERFRHGNPVVTRPTEPAPGLVRVHAADGMVLGVGELADDGRLAPRRVFHGGDKPSNSP